MEIIKGLRTCKTMAALALICCLFLCGCQGGDAADLGPRTMMKEKDTFSYGDSKESIEKIVGKSTESALGHMNNFLNYGDDIQILYRKEDHDPGVYFHIKSKKYTTYKGIRVGDKWDEAKEKLTMLETNGNFSSIIFDGDTQKEVMSPDRTDSWVMVTYTTSDSGIIEAITICDSMAGLQMR